MFSPRQGKTRVDEKIAVKSNFSHFISILFARTNSSGGKWLYLGKRIHLVLIRLLCATCFYRRFLLQAMSESHCFDWALLLALALRDAPLVSQVVEDILLFGMDELALENFIRLRDGIKTLENWAQHEW